MGVGGVGVSKERYCDCPRLPAEKGYDTARMVWGLTMKSQVHKVINSHVNYHACLSACYNHLHLMLLKKHVDLNSKHMYRNLSVVESLTPVPLAFLDKVL